MLCDVCLKAFPSAEPLTWTAPEDAPFDMVSGRRIYEEAQWVPHHPTFLSLKASTDSGCLICSAFWILQRASDIAAQLAAEASSFNIIRPGTRLFIHTWIEGDSEPTVCHEYKVHHSLMMDRYKPEQSNENDEDRCGEGVHEVVQPKNDIQFNSHIEISLESKSKFEAENTLQCSTSLGSPETFSLARRWIQDCAEHHPDCGSLSTPTWYPTRLLDSGPLDSEENILVRLCETGSSTSITKGPYMTLSYCWGLEAPFTLTKQTHSALMSSILFRNCHSVSEMQSASAEGLDDWQREANQMHHIYCNSLCTISAATGTGSSSPILRFRTTDTLRQDELIINWRNKDGTTTETTYHVYSDRLWEKHVVHAPVNSRAWVLQERMLSPRVLYFAENQTFWDCFEKQACETYPHGWVGLRIYTHEGKKSLPSKDNDGSKPRSQTSLRQLHKQWFKLMETYSECRLTYQTDKLIAISAIARRFETYFNDDYMAGMWRQSLENDLVWYVSFPKREPSQPAVYVAPSWSWTSTNSRVSMPGGSRVGGWPPTKSDECFASVEDVQLDYTFNENHHGSLRGGRLRLRGILQRLHLQGSEFPDVSGLSQNEIKFISQKTDKHDDRVFINDILLETNSGVVHLDRDPNRGFDQENRDGVLFCILVYKFGSSHVAVPWNLLLLQVVNADDGVFRRLGVMHLSRGENMERAALSRHDAEANFPCIEYRDGRHSIWII
ncbi:uncharacterized protein EAE98_009693 [Botrytis deweyae]|uniref:Heterokaryon incompatibility domain-containing protein n=1 Tax=Botrytis deweyae TaxID=2478750 RepID=A0ABQ7IAL7_9HELO|nr:uncharacterized protein EAE98_009693 [Botrytis deweyae]KAF7918450.1 hypothetical protein EAE98_009693 [Botrytis deweyae]